MRLNFNKIISTIKHIREYVFPVKKLTDKFKTLNTIQQLETFNLENIKYKFTYSGKWEFTELQILIIR